MLDCRVLLDLTLRSPHRGGQELLVNSEFFKDESLCDIKRLNCINRQTLDHIILQKLQVLNCTREVFLLYE